MKPKTKKLLAILMAALLLPALAACGGGEDIAPDDVPNADSAQALLAWMAKDLMEEMEANGPIALVAQGEDTVNGQHAWLFALGADTPEKFTAEYHFAVTDAGEVLVMDILAGGEYVPFAAG